VADSLELPAADTPESAEAHKHLLQLLHALKRQDAVALVAYHFRHDPAGRDAACRLFDNSIREVVESTVQDVHDRRLPLATLKKRSQRAAARARALAIES
jgi:hypothetical protein